MNNKKKLNKAIKSAREVNEMVSSLLNDNKIVPSLRDDIDMLANQYMKVVFAYVSITLEHHQSIIELTNVRQLSALVLLRPLYESYIRTMWLTTCLSEKTIKAIMQLISKVEDGNFPTLRVMCEEIDEIYNLSASEESMNSFARDLENNKRMLHSYTHCGAELVAIVNNHHHIFTYKEMINILEVSNYYMLSATQACVNATGNLVLSEKVRAITLQYSHIK